MKIISGSLALYILPNVTKEIYGRGVDYADSDKVGRIEESDKHLSAVVAGTKLYEVEFRRGPKYIKGYCSCPYAASQSDYCKHIVAVALKRDDSVGASLPNETEIERNTLEIDHGFGKRIDAMFKNPLEADLELLARASDYGSWVRPHAQITVKSMISQSSDMPLSLGVVKKGFDRIRKLTERSNFDPYFCAGEVSAVFAKTLEVIETRLGTAPLREMIAITMESVVFYYEYLESIDGSDGVWQIPQARVRRLIETIKRAAIGKEEFEKFRESLNHRIEGWGDVFDDLDIQ